MEAIVLAGGLGTRLKSVVAEVPKPLAPILDKVFLDYFVQYFLNQNIDHFIFSVGYKSQMIIDHFKGSAMSKKMSFALEPEPLGTGGAIVNAVNFIKNSNEPFFIFNGDTFFLIQLNILSRLLSENSQANLAIALRSMKENTRYDGVVLREESEEKSGLIKSLGKNQSTLINGGIYLANSRFVNEIKNKSGKFSFESDYLPTSVLKNEVVGKVFNAPFLDIGIPDDYAKAPDFVKTHILGS